MNRFEFGDVNKIIKNL